jgi:hypothetical protein
MKAYLLFLLFIIMGAGARTMFEIAYHGLTKEHGLTPDSETQQLILLAVWYVSMMVVDVLLLNYKEVVYRKVFIALLTLGIVAPTIYMFLTH